uniref:Uncharacterized protein n=1 Tax=viral metagenome TaxID=1070528 RepID=A0A6M3J0V7_9ZZZZ
MAKAKNSKKPTAEDVKDVTVAQDLTPDIARGLFDQRSNLEGLEPRLPQIKILHGEAQMFVMPDTNKVDKFTAVLLDYNKCNAFWIIPFDKSGGGSPPDCASLDSIDLDPMCEDPQSKTGKCRNCEKNAFGSEEGGGRGKACKNMMRLHILIEGQLMPFRLTLPPTSIKVMQEYIPLVESRGQPYQLTITEFSLEAAANKDGIKYSRLVCKDVGKITTTKEAYGIKTFIDQWKEVMRGQAIRSEEIE